MTPHDHPGHHHHGHDHHHDHHDHPPLIAAGHEHLFLGANHDRNARKTWTVVAFCSVMMGIEIAAGLMFNSMALLADGAHMATHAGALLVAAMAYRIARARSADRRFSFGTGKVGDLAAFGSAIGLACTSLFIAVESVERLVHPLPIAFNQAIPVAILGLVVNLVSAWMLHDGHEHGHGHDHGHDHQGHTGHAHGHHDFNLRAAYVHVAADALVSVLAIGGLFVVRQFGWLWVDPVMGIVGAVVIAQWSVQLARQTGVVLLDMEPTGGGLAETIRARVTSNGEQITDLHVWRLGPGHHAAIVCLAGTSPKPTQYYRDQLSDLPGLSHVTVEVSALPDHTH